MDRIRVDAVLRGARSATLRDDLEPVAGSPCHVVEAQTEYGHYTAWLDPAHGCSIARVEVLRRPGDFRFAGHDKGPCPRQAPDHERFTSLDNVRFRKVGEVWVPMEGHVRREDRFANGDSVVSEKTHTRTDVNLAPDHDALGSFVPDDVPNGAVLCVLSSNDTEQQKGTWQYGKVVDNAGRVMRLRRR
jgi:hypothetical protein